MLIGAGEWKGGGFERGGEPDQEMLFFTVSSSASVGFEIKACIFIRIDWAQCNDIPVIYYIKLQDHPYQCFAPSLWKSISSSTQERSSLS